MNKTINQFNGCLSNEVLTIVITSYPPLRDWYTFIAVPSIANPIAAMSMTVIQFATFHVKIAPPSAIVVFLRSRDARCNALQFVPVSHSR